MTPDEDAPDPIDVAVGERLRRLRRARRISQVKLAQALGITFQQVQKYEGGRNRMGPGALIRAAKCLGVQPGELLCPEDMGRPGQSTVPAVLRIVAQVEGAEELIGNYSRLSPRVRTALIVLTRSLAEPQTNEKAAHPEADGPS